MRQVRETKPLVHQITNYVVMNETANATLALGALPVMAHAQEEVGEMAAIAGALVLNIGTLSPDWVEAMILAGQIANQRGTPVVLDPVHEPAPFELGEEPEFPELAEARHTSERFARPSSVPGSSAASAS